MLQIRDEYRIDYDAARGGYGTMLKQKLAPEVQSPINEPSSSK